MLGHSFIDGKIVPTEEARVPIDDLGFLRCFSIYEGITTVGKSPLFLNEHLDRLARSAAHLGLSSPYSRNELFDIVTKLATYVSSERGDIRLVLSGGRSEDGLTPSGESRFYAIVNDMTPLEERVYREGIKVMTQEHQRFMPESKTTHYTLAAMLQSKKREEGAIEILYTSGGEVLEGATCNVFMVKDGVLVTPQEKILHGITRMKTLEIAGSFGKRVEERRIGIEELFTADEVFMTSSFKDVLPVVRVGEHVIGGGMVGPETAFYMREYQELLLKQHINSPLVAAR